MIESIRKMWKIGELRKKIIYTFLMLLVYRLVGVIPAPGVDALKVFTSTELGNTNNLLGLVNMMTGNNFEKMTVMAMGITPYINASIIMQLLTIAIPALERLSKEEDGRQKINRITRYVTIGLAALQAIGLVRGLGFIKAGWLNYVLVGVSMAGGTALAMWIGERITEKGVGNGADYREGNLQRHQPVDLRRNHLQPVQRYCERLHYRERQCHHFRMADAHHRCGHRYPDDHRRNLC